MLNTGQFGLNLKQMHLHTNYEYCDDFWFRKARLLILCENCEDIQYYCVDISNNIKAESGQL